MNSSGIKRGEAVFGDIRGWIDALRDADVLEKSGAKDWDVELGNIIRMMQGSGDGQLSCSLILKITMDPTRYVPEFSRGGTPVIPGSL